MRIYLNTIKNAYNEILKTGIQADYKEKDMGDKIEIKITINKR